MSNSTNDNPSKTPIVTLQPRPGAVNHFTKFATVPNPYVPDNTQKPQSMKAELLIDANTLQGIKQLTQANPARCPAGTVGCGTGDNTGTYTGPHGQVIPNCNACKSVCQIAGENAGSTTLHDAHTKAKQFYEKYGQLMGKRGLEPINEQIAEAYHSGAEMGRR